MVLSSTHSDVPGRETPRPLFVVGLMRSGTSLLYRLLNSHAQIALMYESDLFALRPLLWRSGKPGGWHERLDFWNGALTRHGISGADARALPPSVRGPEEAVLALGQTYARTHKPGAYIGCKSILYCDKLPDIGRAFPEARFIVLWRPVAEIIGSLQRAGETNIYFVPARRERQVFQQYCDLAEGVLALRRLACRVHELRYEELIRDPEGACASLCEFLALPYLPEMVRLDDPKAFAAIPDQTHHFHARYTLAGAAPTQHPKLIPATATKIRSYEHYWASRFAGQPVRLATPSHLPTGPKRQFFVLRRMTERWFYRVHQACFFAKLLVYRYAPLSWLRWYRARGLKL